MRVSLVVAAGRNGVIGRDGGLPWRLPSDLRRFKALTMGKPVIMGRKTWESLPKRPLAGRRNIVVSRKPGFAAEGALTAKSPQEAVALAKSEAPEEIMVIGGAEIYAQFLPFANRIYLSEVHLAPDGDSRFPLLSPAEWREMERTDFTAAPGDDAGYTLSVLERVTA